MPARTDGPEAERIATGNEAALRFLLRAKGIANLPDRAALRRFAAAQPQVFDAEMLAFAGVEAPVAVLTAILLDADLRPDDRVLVAGIAPPDWLGTLAHLVVAPDVTPDTLRAVALTLGARVVVAPGGWLAAAGLADAQASGPCCVDADGWSDCKRAGNAPSQDDAPP